MAERERRNISSTHSPKGLPLSQVGETPHGDNTAVSLLEVDGDDIRVVYQNDNSHQVEAGLSTFAKQSWWRDKRMMSGGQYYREMDEATAARFGVPEEGKRIAVWFEQEPVGALARTARSSLMAPGGVLPCTASRLFPG